MSHNGRKPVLRIRYRMPEKRFGANLVLAKDGRNEKAGGRILSVRKVPREKILKVHEYLPFDPNQLLREFREQERQNKREVTVNV